ncbi:PHD finger domain-containing protein [Delitschia confertaspora ATCC 74209]|uniref:PHD finger domain-containing protein n=1 Tax=Delitschia confertaspora ATCC 74209 TaxID=1513339 RepID=A0A9P4MSU2_9PLEO|nr:PHD finger domain-containing protein [Delitschia confertaspora ATCC 74209]
MPPAAALRAVAAATTGPTPDRRQSTRQGRTNVTRPANYYARTFPGRMGTMGGLEETPPATNPHPGLCPALTHFTQAVDAFPKELIKHFSMFKEVEAKIHDPEHVLRLLLDEISRLPIPTKSERYNVGQNQNGLQADGSTTGSLFPPNFEQLPSEEQAELRKRQLFFRLRMVIMSMLPTLDEKLVVLTTAKSAKDKGLARMNSSYVHLDDEISEEARYGSLTHWAYATDKEEKKKGGTTHERQRREVASANNLAAAAQAVHDADSIAAKSEARREAMMAKRGRNQHVDSDFDDSRPAKKTQKRKGHTDNGASQAGSIGLGISNGAQQPGKRKKTEKALAATATAPPMERSLSGALQSAASGGRNGNSPRGTPGADNGGKRKPRTVPATGRKRGPIGAQSPSLVSSPVTSNFAASREITNAAHRHQSSRARKNSTTNSVTSVAQDSVSGQRPASSQSNRPVTTSNAITELEQAAGVVRESHSVKGDSTPKEPVDATAPFEPSHLKHEETVEDTEPTQDQEPEAMDIDEPVLARAVSKTGRTSKTATPVVGAFPDVPMARSRSTRNANNSNGSQAPSENNSTTATTKRTHKKTNSTHAAALASPALKPTPQNTTIKSAASSPASSPAPDPEFSEGVDEDGDEPRYCYCNEVSYGNMIACDNTDCPREWFHLACVNMEKAPNARTKWFCSEECRETYEKKKEKGKRPGSSRQ